MKIEMTLEQAQGLLALARAALHSAARRYAREAALLGEAPDEEAELEARALDFQTYFAAVELLRREDERREISGGRGPGVA